MTEEIELPGDFSGVVPLFPLPELVMFPSAVQQLYLFESRYREMFEDAMAGEQLIAMATLSPGYSESEYYGRPAVADHVCIGKVSEHRKNDDGTCNLVLIGVARAKIVEELAPVRSYRSARVRVLESAQTVDEVTYKLGAELAEYLETLSPTTRSIAREFTAERISLGMLADVISFYFPFTMSQKLELLAESETVNRVRMVLEFIRAIQPEEEEESPDGQLGDGLPPFSQN